ncbi:acyl-coenzyme A diphosphatase FITM2-like [Dysidea avara]|uniref:acyl-coenzyme A diphosphatase FITM2-like n=1 Tax=Dysidea avara TaxID=196820 RepID=UPI00332A3371
MESCQNLVLYTNVKTKILFLFVTVIVGSTLCSLSLSPPAYFDNPKNFLNKAFVKFSWGWTLLLLVPLVILTSYVYELGSRAGVVKNCIRIVISHVIWFVVTTAFVILDDNVGTCSKAGFVHKSPCYSNKGIWYGFDISGHTFLLCYIIFVITEECIPIIPQTWNKAENILHRPILLRRYKKISSVLNWLRWYATFIIILACIMTLATNLYFHTMPEKILGFLVAVLSWYITYCIMYGNIWFLPKPDYTTKELFKEQH